VWYCNCPCILSLLLLLLCKLNRILFCTSVVYHHHQLSESEVGLVTIESSGTQNTCTYPTRHKKTRAAASVDPTNHRRKQMTNASSLPPHLLTPREEDEVKTFIENFITMPQRDLSKVMGTDTGTSRSGGFYKRIVDIIAEGIEARKKVGIECVDSDWLSSSQQREVRLEVSRACWSLVVFSFICFADDKYLVCLLISSSYFVVVKLPC